MKLSDKIQVAIDSSDDVSVGTLCGWLSDAIALENKAAHYEHHRERLAEELNDKNTSFSQMHRRAQAAESMLAKLLRQRNALLLGNVRTLESLANAIAVYSARPSKSVYHGVRRLMGWLASDIGKLHEDVQRAASQENSEWRHLAVGLLAHPYEGQDANDSSETNDWVRTHPYALTKSSPELRAMVGTKFHKLRADAKRSDHSCAHTLSVEAYEALVTERDTYRLALLDALGVAASGLAADALVAEFRAELKRPKRPRIDLTPEDMAKLIASVTPQEQAPEPSVIDRVIGLEASTSKGTSDVIAQAYVKLNDDLRSELERRCVSLQDRLATTKADLAEVVDQRTKLEAHISTMAKLSGDLEEAQSTIRTLVNQIAEQTAEECTLEITRSRLVSIVVNKLAPGVELEPREHQIGRLLKLIEDGIERLQEPTKADPMPGLRRAHELLRIAHEEAATIGYSGGVWHAIHTIESEMHGIEGTPYVWPDRQQHLEVTESMIKRNRERADLIAGIRGVLGDRNTGDLIDDVRILAAERQSARESSRLFEEQLDNARETLKRILAVCDGKYTDSTRHQDIPQINRFALEAVRAQARKLRDATANQRTLELETNISLVRMRLLERIDTACKRWEASGQTGAGWIACVEAVFKALNDPEMPWRSQP